ncbi:MAG: glycogen synthase [Patescibacteria group bacterium]
MPSRKINLLMASAEVAPLAKAGGLADVVPSLSFALQEKNCQANIIMPKYGFIKEKENKLKKTNKRVEIDTENGKEEARAWQTVLGGVKVVLLENEKYFGKDKIYWGNGPERFLFFSRAVVEILPYLDDSPDIIHCHDYHTALIPSLLQLKEDDLYKNIPTIYTIHNLNYQGRAEIDSLSLKKSPEEHLKSLSRDPDKSKINFMAQGILGADSVTTVSPTYAEEITDSPQGAGLERVISQNKHKITGIVNGIDVKQYDPATDPALHYNYSLESIEGKRKNKPKLQERLGLPRDENKLLVGFISRLVWQKGVDLIGEELMNLDIQLAVLGTGDKKYEKAIKELAGKHPDKVSAQIMFDEEFARQIYAGSDIYLLPSRFEPCGLGQMIAMRYGTVPLVRSTGGLKDTVDNSVGFSFQKFSESALRRKLRQALKVYKEDASGWGKMSANCMRRDFSWKSSAEEYINLYRKLLEDL